MLALEDITAGYLERPVLRGISLRVDEGEIVALIGANGAGKSTTLKVIAGLLPHRAGHIGFDGRALGGNSPVNRVREGVVLVPEGRRVFPALTVAENLKVGAFSRRDRDDYATDQERVFQLFPVLAQRARQHASTLSGGEQQMLAIGRGLMARPRCLLLDEPSLGLAPMMIRTVWEAIGRINASGVSVLIVEQKAFVALKLAGRGYVLENGRIIAEGASATLIGDPRVKRAYLR